MGGTPDLLHREVAGAKAILGNDSKIIVIQGGSATCTRDSSSRRTRRNTGNVVRNAAGPACEADCANGGNKQNKHGCHDGANERSCGGKRSLTGPSAGQGEHPSGRKCHPPWRWRPSQETQAEESPLSQLQMFRIAQAGKLLQAQSEQGIALPRMEVYICHPSDRVTGTGDLTIRFRTSSS